MPTKGDSKVKAVILAGGFATRLRPLSCTRPKTLFPIVNKPLLQWIFERLARDGVSEALLAVNRLTGFYIKEHRVPRRGITVRYSHHPPRKPLGTAGPVKHAEQLLGHEPFLVLNGDIFADISYKEIMETHMKTGALATLSLYNVEDPSRYGVAEIAKSGRIKRFIEKPPKGTEPSNLINAGGYVQSPGKFELKHPFALDKGVSISNGAVIGPYAVLGKKVTVGKNAQIRDSVIFSGTKIGDSAWIKGAFIGEEAGIGDDVKIGKGCIIADHARIMKGVSLDEDTS